MENVSLPLFQLRQFDMSMFSFWIIYMKLPVRCSVSEQKITFMKKTQKLPPACLCSVEWPELYSKDVRFEIWPEHQASWLAVVFLDFLPRSGIIPGKYLDYPAIHTVYVTVIGRRWSGMYCEGSLLDVINVALFIAKFVWRQANS